MIYIYNTGMDRFLGDIKSMIGFEPGWYWRISWGFVSPFFMGVSLMIIYMFLFFSFCGIVLQLNYQVLKIL